MPQFEGYALRIRQITLAPGALVGYHSHAHGPVVAYLVSGEYTEHRDGIGEVVHQPGEQWVEGADVAHWSENRGTEPTVLINVDIRQVQ
jgi:quercetin dioxygenase-like cupin family protein